MKKKKRKCIAARKKKKFQLSSLPLGSVFVHPSCPINSGCIAYSQISKHPICPQYLPFEASAWGSIVSVPRGPKLIGRALCMVSLKPLSLGRSKREVPSCPSPSEQEKEHAQRFDNFLEEIISDFQLLLYIDV